MTQNRNRTGPFVSPCFIFSYRKSKRDLIFRIPAVDLLGFPSFYPFSPMTFFFFSFIVFIFYYMFRRAFGQAARNMSTYTTDKASPFTRAVITSMRKLYGILTRCSFFSFSFGCER